MSFAPSSVLKLRRMGFSILLETGAGASAGFSDEDYTRPAWDIMEHMGLEGVLDESFQVKNHKTKKSIGIM